MAKNPFAAYGGKETKEEEEKEHGVKLDAPLKSHKGEETPEEEEAEEEEIEERGLEGEAELTPNDFVTEVRSLLERLDGPPPKAPKTLSFNEMKLPL